MIKRYLKNILVSIDQMANSLLLGDPDETISSRAGKWYKSGVKLPAKIIDFVFGKKHCEKKIEEDEGDKAILP